MKATFAAGCFWGVKDAFDEAKGVKSTVAGYTGGHSVNPTYKEVCGHGTGHAEAVEVEYDPSRVSYERLLDVFWRIHDPTTPGRQGPDVGSQYRSAIFYHDEEQRQAAVRSLEDHQKKIKKRIVTQISSAGPFYPAEEYHQHYHKKNPLSLACLASFLKKRK